MNVPQKKAEISEHIAVQTRAVHSINKKTTNVPQISPFKPKPTYSKSGQNLRLQAKSLLLKSFILTQTVLTLLLYIKFLRVAELFYMSHNEF